MAEILTQSEIDELLRNLQSGQLNAEEIESEKQGRKIRVYDFRSANKFTKEQIRTFHGIYENFSRLFSSYFSGMLRTVCGAQVASIEEQTYSEFNNSLSDPVVLGIAEFSPLEGSTLIEIAPSIAYAMIDCLLGGPGKEFEDKRGFTDIELALLERIMKQILVFLRDSWSNLVAIEPELQRMETNARFVQILAPNETIVIITLNVIIGEIHGMINFCIPYIVLEPVMKNLSTKYLYSSNRESVKEGAHKADILDRIQNSYMEVRGILGETTLLMRDLMDLQKGDVIQLDQKITEEVLIKVQDKVRFYGILGKRKKKLAVRINKVLKDEVLEDE
ncbi:MAG: flagellar motor switch protein FliM [Clostridia bacterium]|jgi:flagellar motor switch protein FliM